MNIQIKVEEVFKIKVGKVWKEFKKVEEWEGMTKFKSKDGESVIVDNSFDLANIISKVFKEDNYTAHVLKASPMIGLEIKKEWERNTEQREPPKFMPAD